MDYKSFLSSDLFFKTLLYGGEALFLFLLVLYKRYVSFKFKELFAAALIASAIAVFTYLTVRMNSVSFKVVFFISSIMISYIFYWIFVKDGGENKKHLN